MCVCVCLRQDISSNLYAIGCTDAWSTCDKQRENRGGWQRGMRLPAPHSLFDWRWLIWINARIFIKLAARTAEREWVEREREMCAPPTDYATDLLFNGFVHVSAYFRSHKVSTTNQAAFVGRQGGAPRGRATSFAKWRWIFCGQRHNKFAEN